MNDWSLLKYAGGLSLAAVSAGGGTDPYGHDTPSTSPGRLGGPQHQSVVAGIVNSVEDVWGEGYYARTEIYFVTAGGNKSRRFADVGVFDTSGNLVAVYQIGVGTQGNLPVARERYAIDDIFEYGLYRGEPFDGPIIFIPYK